MIVALQYCIGFCHTSTLLSHGYTYVPSLLNLPPTFQPIPLLTEPWFGFPDSYSKFPLAIYFTYGNVYQFSSVQFSSAQSLSCVWLFATPWIAACQASLSIITNSQSSLRLTPIESVIPSSHLILCRPLLLLPPILPSIRVFSNESTRHMRWPKYWSFNLSISPSNEYPELVSFRMDWLDFLAVQGTLKSLLQQHSSKKSIICAQLSSLSNSHIHTWPLEKP